MDGNVSHLEKMTDYKSYAKHGSDWDDFCIALTASYSNNHSCCRTDDLQETRLSPVSQVQHSNCCHCRTDYLHQHLYCCIRCAVRAACECTPNHLGVGSNCQRRRCINFYCQHSQ